MKYINTIIIILILVITYVYMQHWTTSIYTNKQYLSFISLIQASTGVILAFAITLQVLNYRISYANEIKNNYNELSKIFFDDILLLFMNNSDMTYYYNDLTGIKKIDENTKRNIAKEHTISMLIFSKMAKFAITIDETHNSDAAQKVHLWLGHIYDTYMKSPTFRYYWIHEYKPKFSGPASRKYMMKYYGL